MNKPRGKALVSGKFKVIHSGHIRLFKLARELSEELVVALDVTDLDSSDIDWRLKALESIDFVSRVITYKSDIEMILLDERPDTVVKGSEFSQASNVEEKVIAQWGGRLIFSSGDSFFSEKDMIGSPYVDSNVNRFPLPLDFMQRHEITSPRLIEILGAFREINVCVIGDLIIDEFINCHPLGMSQEEPTIVVTPIDKRRFLGGAGIVAAHCASLGARTTLLTIRGDDEAGQWSATQAQEYAIEMIALVDSTRPTTLKQRFRSGSQTLLKLTHLRQENISSDLEVNLLETFKSKMSNFDLIIFSDFSYGVLTKKVTEEILRDAKEAEIFIASDSQSSSQIGDLSRFEFSDLITATEREARLELKDENSGLVVLAEKLRFKLNAENLLLKLGGDGVMIHGTSESGMMLATDQVPALNDAFIDTSGAGDSLLATAALSLASSATIYEATLLGSLVAAIQVGRIGNTPITSSSVSELLHQ
jgi:rfaE bifunctional protein kinase chain/domain